MWQFQFNCHHASSTTAKVTTVIGISLNCYCHHSHSAIEVQGPCCLRSQATGELMCAAPSQPVKAAHFSAAHAVPSLRWQGVLQDSESAPAHSC